MLCMYRRNIDRIRQTLYSIMNFVYAIRIGAGKEITQ